MRLNPIRAVQDWSKKKQMKAALVRELEKRRQPRVGVEVPSNDPMWAVAVMELLKEHPKLKAVRMNESVVLCHRAQFDGDTSEGLKQTMQAGGFILNPGDKL